MGLSYPLASTLAVNVDSPAKTSRPAAVGILYEIAYSLSFPFRCAFLGFFYNMTILL